MCGGVQYAIRKADEDEINTVLRKTFYPQPNAQIPVVDDDGVITLIQWGRREGEDTNANVPITGWARADSITAGKWAKYDFKDILIPVIRFMEKDKAKTSHWFKMEHGNYLRGIEINSAGKRFGFIVTDPSKGPFEEIHDRWPVIVDGAFKPQALEAIRDVSVIGRQLGLFDSK